MASARARPASILSYNEQDTSAQIDEEVKLALKIENLTGMERNPPLALSFGQQKRVSIASVLAMGSRILVMDEPTAGTGS